MVDRAPPEIRDADRPPRVDEAARARAREAREAAAERALIAAVPLLERIAVALERIALNTGGPR